MGDIKEVGITERRHGNDIEAIHQWNRDRNELEEKRRRLKSENEAYVNRTRELSSEIERIENSLVTTREDMEATEKKISEYPNRIERLKSESEILVAKLNSIKLQITGSREDEESTRLLRKTLTEEYENLENERAVLVKRNNEMEDALDEISIQKDKNLPKLKKYDGILRKARKVFYDAESRMEVSLKLKQGKIVCKLPCI